MIRWWNREEKIVMQKSLWLAAFSTLIVHLLCVHLFADTVPESVDYTRDIKPLLKARCYSCHGSLKQEAGLRLDSGRLIRKGSENGTVVATGPSQATLIERIETSDLSRRMPPEGEPLSAAQIARLKVWIEQGSISPDDEQPEIDPRSHWAFQPPVRPRVPDVLHAEWVRNPIDAFISKEHTKQQLTPLPPANKAVILRRVTLDLTGLPPTRQELKAFLTDESPEAYGKVVDRLLDSAQYGERWARHWMDVWRYADWYGRRYVPDVWNSAPQIWRWRDWIVKSLNNDKAYSQMVSEMLAADELSPEDDEAGHATGYLIRNWYALNPNDWMRSNVEHVGKAFLGLTFNCAHCHDHKYDPISQEDYFRFRAFFEPISIRQDRVPQEADPGPFQEYSYSQLRKIVRLGAVRVYDKFPDASTWFYSGGDERNRVTERGSIPAGLPAVLSPEPLKIEPVSLPARAWYPGLRPAIHETVLQEIRATLSKLESQLPAARESVAAALPALQSKLTDAQAEFDQARLKSEQGGKSGALVGRQSLLLDATTGRRVVQHRLQQVKSLSDGSTIQFQLQILKDAHVNFQLAKDFSKALTAGYLGFENGRIMSYQPATFTEFEVGRYDFANGQNRFAVVLQLQADRCLLTVRSMTDDRLLVDNVPIARNEWSPVGDPNRGITFDARPGAVAAIDEFSLTEPVAVDGPPESDVRQSVRTWAHFDFEPPNYRDQSDVVGVDGWIGSSFSQAGGTSRVSSTFGDESLRPFAKALNEARRAFEAQSLKLQSLEARQKARLVELESTQARIDADRAKFGETSGADVDALARRAGRLSREAAVLTAEADVLTKDQMLAEAETKPADAPNRAKDISDASAQLQTAMTSLDAARQAVSEPTLTYPSFSPTYPATSTGRRRALASWIANRQNPLTARVAVNHIWLRHFHSPLVSTVADFGRNGSPPTHPELLDWLAVELMDSGWSMKHIHRLIVTSNTYTMSSNAGSDGQAMRDRDPENRFLWRMNAGRMEAEVVRDSLLACSGQLDRQMGGQELENSLALTTRRRTLYYSCQPEIDGKSAFGALFDAPEPSDCYRRSRSIIPQQALALTNSDLVHELSGILSKDLWESLPTDQQTNPTAFVVAAHEQILTRVPTQKELDVCVEFLTSTVDEPGRARESLVRALLNHNDFVAIR